MNILIVRLSSLGDIILSLPLLHPLRRGFSDAKIAWAVEKRFEPLIRGHKNIDRVIALDTKQWRYDLKKRKLLPVIKDIGASVRVLRDFNPDITIDPQGLIKSASIAWLSGARLRIGFERDSCREAVSCHLNNYHVYPPRDSHVIEKNLRLLSPLGIVSPNVCFDIPVDPLAEASTESFWKKEGLVGKRVIGVQAAAAWETKLIPVETYAAALREVISEKIVPVLLWTPPERARVERLNDLLGRRAVLSPRTSLSQLYSLIRRFDVFIAPDTGPMHIASALGVPCLALFGPSSPLWNGPWGEQHRVIYKNPGCSPCYKRTCEKPDCRESFTGLELAENLMELLDA